MNPDTSEEPNSHARRSFLKKLSLISAGSIVAPAFVNADTSGHLSSPFGNSAVIQAGKAAIATILHTGDLHSQIETHDEFFIEDGKVTYKKRGGFAVLKTMINKLRSENPGNTLLIDGGDCIQGSGLAALTDGRAIVPLINDIAYDLMIPGNWEVVYKKEMMLKNMGGYSASKICANMLHDTQDDLNGTNIFHPYWTKTMAGIKMGFIGYNDPKVPKRQPPAFSKGIKFTNPTDTVAKHIKTLKEVERCDMIFLVTHLGLAQQVDLANDPSTEGVDYVLGADTHERIRTPLKGTYAQVTEPGAFGSFVSKLDIVVEDGVIKDRRYALLDVDPEKYKPDQKMTALIKKEKQPYHQQLSTVIGSTRIPLLRYYVLETPMDNMITDALMWKFKPDIALSNGFRFCPPLAPKKGSDHALITMDYLWSMMPIDSEVKSGMVKGAQLWDWLENELHNVFASKTAERQGGWVVRMKGMKINFTMNNAQGKRLNSVTINDQPLDLEHIYTIASCEREGDPDDTLCRLGKVQEPKPLGSTVHETMIAYLKANSPVTPRVEGRVTATDAPPTLLSQLEGYGYEFF